MAEAYSLDLIFLGAVLRPSEMFGAARKRGVSINKGKCIQKAYNLSFSKLELLLL